MRLQMFLGDDCVLHAIRRNWCSCSRFSNSVAKFYPVPIPNEKPLDYLKVLNASCTRDGAICRNGMRLGGSFLRC